LVFPGAEGVFGIADAFSWWEGLVEVGGVIFGVGLVLNAPETAGAESSFIALCGRPSFQCSFGDSFGGWGAESPGCFIPGGFWGWEFGRKGLGAGADGEAAAEGEGVEVGAFNADGEGFPVAESLFAGESGGAAT